MRIPFPGPYLPRGRILLPSAVLTRLAPPDARKVHFRLTAGSLKAHAWGCDNCPHLWVDMCRVAHDWMGFSGCKARVERLPKCPLK